MTECTHKLLDTSTNRTVCVRCSRDIYLYMDVDPTLELAELKDEVAYCVNKITKLQAALLDARDVIANLRCGISIKQETSDDYTNCHLAYVDKDDYSDSKIALTAIDEALK